MNGDGTRSTAIGAVPVAPRLQLVLHHRYASGSTRDLSGYEHHGFRVPSSPGGAPADPSSFDGATTRVAVFPTPVLQHLGALRVQARVAVEELGDRRTIVEGYLAFAFAVEPDGALAGAILTDRRWESVSTGPGVVPLHRWVDVAFVYDGRDTSLLLIDGVIVATRLCPLGRAGDVRWPYGLNIGAWPDGNLRVFKGSIDEVRLWVLGED